MNPHSAGAIAAGGALSARVESAIQSKVLGQEHIVQRLLVCLLAGGHVLLEGVPGLAKTLMVRTLAESLDVDFKRIQFTPDLLPSDVVGSLVFRPDRGVFVPSKGPIFAHLVLADELNRAPAKVQSALLEAMQEGQVTLGGRALPLPDPFMVLATENPIEQQGTYPLAEAQLDRFLLMLRLGYPEKDDEQAILRSVTDGQQAAIAKVATAEDLLAERRRVEAVTVEDLLIEYVTDVIRATRDPAAVGLPELEGLIEFGASPRAGIALISAARALAYLRDRPYVVPDDVKDLAHDALRHRLVLTYEASARGIDPDEILDRILAAVPLP